MSRSDEPMPISASLDRVVRSLRSDSGSTSVMGGVFGRWEEAVGEAVAAHVQPIKLDGSTLVVGVDDPAWATQLRFLESTMKARLAEVTGAVIETIEVRVQPRRR